MRRRPLGRSGLRVTELGFGGAPLGGMYSAVDETTARAALEAAWEAGIRYFDTAPLYGFGLSERRFGEFLRTKPRHEFVISTKVGRILRPAKTRNGKDGSLAAFFDALPNEATFDFSARGVEQSLEDSLARLGLDRIDVLYLHDPEHHVEEAIAEAYPALRALRDRGIVRAIGIGTNYVDIAEAFVGRCELDVCMAAGRYTLLDRTAAASLLPLCSQRDVAFIAAGVFNSGILGRPFPADDATFDYVPAKPDTLERARLMARACERYGTDLPTAALRFPLDAAVVACSLVGMRSALEVNANVQRFGTDLPQSLTAELETHSILRNADPR